jgi:hypothetical protein
LPRVIRASTRAGNPLARSFARSLGSSVSSAGFATIRVRWHYDLCATQPDAVALDGDGRNSRLRRLLKHLTTPGVEIAW